MGLLTEAEVARFRAEGCVVVPDAVTPEQLAAMRRSFEGWVEDSRAETEAYGETLDGRPRFDLEPGHSAERPALRRVASPTELDDAFLDTVQTAPMMDAVADLMGPDLRFHHSKINSKLPGSATVVKWHQDFTFDPHSNDDVITCLIFLDDVTLENGPLRTLPGSHRGPLYSLWQEGRFTGAIAEETAARFEQDAVLHTGPAGSACLMHARVAHASTENLSAQPRTLFIAVIAAADAVPLAPNPVPSRHAGLLLRGREPGRIRSTAFEMQTPEIPEGASFFVQQAGS